MSSLEPEPINLVTLSPEFPLWIQPEEYQRLTQKKQGGWSHCDSQLEWLAKLHYLRQGFKEGRLQKDDFYKKEEDLVLAWWRRWT